MGATPRAVLLVATAIAAIIAVALVRQPPAPPATASAPPTASAATVTSSPSPAASPSAAPTATAVAATDDPFGAQWLFYGTADGRIHRELSAGAPSGVSVKVCDGQVVEMTIAPNGPGMLVVCEVPRRAGTSVGYLVEIGATQADTRVLQLTGRFAGAAWSPDAAAIVHPGELVHTPTAPIPAAGVNVYDVSTRQDRQILAPENGLGELRWTELGPSVFKPQRQPNVLRRPEQAGTFVLRGDTWTRLSARRLIDHRGGVSLLELEERSDSGSRIPPLVFVRRSDNETLLTPSDVPVEHALAVLDDGLVLTWRPAPGPGVIVAYDGAGRPAATTATRFGATHTEIHSATLIRTGPRPGWLVSTWVDHSSQILAIHTYRIVDHKVVSVDVRPPGSVTALSALVSR